MADNYNAVAFAADVLAALEEEADDVQRPSDGVVRLEVALDRDGFAEWIIAALVEHGLAVLGDRDTLRETVARAIRDRVRLGPIGPNSTAIIESGGRVSLTVSEADDAADAVLDVLYGGDGSSSNTERSEQ